MCLNRSSRPASGAYRGAADRLPPHPFEVLVDRRVGKDLRKVPRHVVAAFLRMLDELEDPITSRPGLDVKKLRQLPGEAYRVRLGGYRVMFALDKAGRRVLVTSVRPRKKAYG